MLIKNFANIIKKNIKNILKIKKIKKSRKCRGLIPGLNGDNVKYYPLYYIYNVNIKKLF